MFEILEEQPRASLNGGLNRKTRDARKDSDEL
jgi:hypothetical protein